MNKRIMYTVRERDGREYHVFEDGTCSGFGEGATVSNRIDLFINEAVNQARKADATRR